MWILSFLLFTADLNGSAGQQLTTVLNPVYAREIAVFGATTENLILSAHGLTSISQDILIISDKLDYTLKKFDRKSAIIKKVGRRGKNQGEFRRGPGPVDSYNDRIAVADFASSRIQIFSADLEYRSSFYASGHVFNLKFDADGNLWLGVLSNRRGENLAKVDLSGKVLQTIQLRNTSDDEFDNLFSFATTRSGNIVVAYAFQNKIEIWTTRGVFIREFEIPGIPSRPKKMKRSRGLFAEALEIPAENIFWSVTTDNHSNIYVLAADHSLAPNRDVYVVDPYGNLTSILTLPNRSYHISLGPRGELYSIENERTLVKKYLLSRQK